MNPGRRPHRILIVDDDAGQRSLLDSFLKGEEFATVTVDSGERALELVRQEEFSLMISDVRMPGISGLELVRQLNARGLMTPIILITGHGDIDMAVAAIKLGAFNFIEKPFDEHRLLASIHEAVEQGRWRTNDAAELEKIQSRFNSLSHRQRQVMELAVAGLSSKEIGARLKISSKTVENHRAWLMERIGARNLAELVRMAMQIQRRP